MIRSGLAFVASHVHVSGDLPVTILPGHSFRRAQLNEIELIRTFLHESRPRPYFQWINYEGKVREKRSVASTQFHIESLPQEEWKYWVVAFEGQNNMVHEIEKVGLLLPVDLEFAFQLYFSESGQAGEVVGRQLMPLHILERYGHPEQTFKNAAELTADQISYLGSLWQMYKTVPVQFSFITSALNNFAALRRAPMTSDLFVVGLFSIIESLVTHAPRLTETLDSINHQISNKIVLPRKKYSRSISLEVYFPQVSEATVWKKLYGYRSSVAHGNTANFNSEYRVLKSHEAVTRFLRDNVKELILLALRESEFIADLRRC